MDSPRNGIVDSDFDAIQTLSRINLPAPITPADYARRRAWYTFFETMESLDRMLARIAPFTKSYKETLREAQAEPQRTDSAPAVDSESV
jgi:hypothetical protein